MFEKRKEFLIKEDLFQELILKHCPSSLRLKYKERVLERLPDSHKIAILASSIASHIVYNEGLGWIDSIGARDHYQTVLSYMKFYQHVDSLVDSVSKSHLSEKDKIVSLNSERLKYYNQADIIIENSESLNKILKNIIKIL